jgi:hypothetical protein
MAQNLGGFPAYVAKVAVTRGCALICTTVEGEVDLPAGANSTKVIGYALDDAAIGERVAVHLLSSPGEAKAFAGGNISIGDYVLTTGSAGKVAALTLGASNQYVIGKATQAAADGQLFSVIPCNFIAQGA